MRIVPTLACSTVTVACAVAALATGPVHARGADDPTAPAADHTALATRVSERYRAVAHLQRPTLVVVNLPETAASDIGTLGMWTQSIRVERGDDGGVARLSLEHVEREQGGTAIAADPTVWTIRVPQLPDRCLQAPRPAIADGAALVRALATIQRDAMPPEPLLPLDALLVLDGSLDALTGTPCAASPLTETDPLAAPLRGAVFYSFARERPVETMRLAGPRAVVAVAIDVETALVAAAVVEIDAMALGVFDEPGVTLHVMCAGGVPQLVANPEPWPTIGCGEAGWTAVEAMAGAVRADTLARIRTDRSEYESMATLMRAGLSMREPNDPQRRWTELSLGRLERLLAAAGEPDAELPVRPEPSGAGGHP